MFESRFRKNFAGTYDEDWLKCRNPLLPVDFDVNVNNAASVGLILKPYLQGGKLVQLENLSPQGRLSFYLPTIDLKPETSVKGERNRHQQALLQRALDSLDKALIQWLKPDSVLGPRPRFLPAQWYCSFEGESVKL